MAQYGAFSVFQRITADSLNAIIPQSITKQTTNGIVSNTTLTLDPELSGITLGVGTWSIEVMLLASPAATQATPVPSLKTGWGFTGTLANSPVRITTGPSSANASIPTAMGSVNIGSNGTFASGGLYGLYQGGVAYAQIGENCLDVQVSAAGTFGILVAQNITSTTAMNVRVGSYVRWRQIG